MGHTVRATSNKGKKSSYLSPYESVNNARLYRGKPKPDVKRERTETKKQLPVIGLDHITYNFFNKQADLFGILRLIRQYEQGGLAKTYPSSPEQEELVNYIAKLDAKRFDEFKRSIDDQINGKTE